MKASKSWEQCYARAEKEIKEDIMDKFPCEVKKLRDMLGTRKPSERAIVEYARWARADELQRISAANIEEDGDIAKSVKGRACSPCCETKFCLRDTR